MVSWTSWRPRRFCRRLGRSRNFAREDTRGNNGRGSRSSGAYGLGRWSGQGSSRGPSPVGSRRLGSRRERCRTKSPRNARAPSHVVASARSRRLSLQAGEVLFLSSDTSQMLQKRPSTASQRRLFLFLSSATTFSIDFPYTSRKAGFQNAFLSSFPPISRNLAKPEQSN